MQMSFRIYHPFTVIRMPLFRQILGIFFVFVCSPVSLEVYRFNQFLSTLCHVLQLFELKREKNKIHMNDNEA